MPLNKSLVPGSLAETEPGAFGINRSVLDPKMLQKVRRATVLSFLFARQIRQVLDFDDPTQDGNFVRAGVGKVPPLALNP